MSNNTETQENKQLSAKDKSKDQNPNSLTGVIDQVVDKTDSDERHVSLGEILDAFGKRSFGPVLLILGIFVMSPIGAIPGVPAAFGAVIILLAGQILLGLEHPWLPDRLLRLKFKRRKLTKAHDKGRPWAKWMDSFIGRRLEFLASGVAVYPIAVICIVLALSFVPLELIPFAVMVPAAGIVLFSLGLTARDGVWTSLGFAVTGATVWLAIRYWPF